MKAPLHGTVPALGAGLRLTSVQRQRTVQQRVPYHPTVLYRRATRLRLRAARCVPVTDGCACEAGVAVAPDSLLCFVERGFSRRHLDSLLCSFERGYTCPKRRECDSSVGLTGTYLPRRPKDLPPRPLPFRPPPFWPPFPFVAIGLPPPPRARSETPHSHRRVRPRPSSAAGDFAAGELVLHLTCLRIACVRYSNNRKQFLSLVL